MARDSLSERVERLELTVQGLEGLPGEVAGLRADVASLGDRMTGVETQVLHLRTEMQVEFSAVRGETGTELISVRSEMASGYASVKTELRQEIAELREEMHEGFAGARDDLLLGLETVTRDLGQQIRESAEEGKRHSRVLCEELVTRITTLGEQWAVPGRTPPASRRKK